QCLARVDVADPDDQAAVHEQLLEGDAPSAADAIEVVRIESPGEGLGRKVRQQRVALRFAARVEEAAEAARVVEAQRDAGLEYQLEMIMRVARSDGWHRPQVAGHAQMQQQCS